MLDEALRFILNRAEVSLAATFLESELIGISKDSFERLKSERFLKYIQYDPENEPYYPPGDGGEGCLVRKIDGKYLAFRAEGSPINLAVEELNRWAFDLPAFADRIKNKNEFTGKSDHSFSNQLLYIGTDFTINTAVLLGFFGDEDTALNELLSLWSKIDLHDHAVVVCPTFAFSQRSKKKLSDMGVVVVSYDQVVDGNLKIDLKRLGLSQRVKATISRSARVDGGREDTYKCDEVIKFHDRQDSSGGYVVQVNNSTEFSIPRVSYALLLFMAIALKADKKGLISLKQTDIYGITDDQGDENRLSYLLSDLRKLFKNKCKNSNELIQTIRGKGCCISTHPDHIEVPESGWLKKKLDELIPAIKKERQLRKSRK